MLQQAITNSLETNEENRNYKKEPNGNYRTEKYHLQYKTLKVGGGVVAGWAVTPEESDTTFFKC